MRIKAAHPNLGVVMYNALDTNVGKALDLYGEWGRDEQELLGQILRPGDITIDAGSHVGTMSLFLSRVVGPSGQVYAFEPQRQLHQLTCGNMALNGITNVFCERKAVSNKVGEIVVPAIDFDKEGCHGCTALDETNFLGESVPTLTIDSLNLVRCRLIKLDVEGMELQALEGARRTVQSYKPALFIRAQYDPTENTLSLATQKVARLVQSFNYDMYWHFSRRFHEDNHFKNPKDQFGEEQDLFILAVPHVDGSNIEGLERVVVPDA